jgi:hypothetical protein
MLNLTQNIRLFQTVLGARIRKFLSDPEILTGSSSESDSALDAYSTVKQGKFGQGANFGQNWMLS